jgi:hypothetical protein
MVSSAWKKQTYRVRSDRFVAGKRALLVLGLEILLTRTAYGTDPIVRKGFERGSGSDPAVRISLRWIVDIATDSTNVFLHLPALFLVKYRTGIIISYVCFFSRELRLPAVVSTGLYA